MSTTGNPLISIVCTQCAAANRSLELAETRAETLGKATDAALAAAKLAFDERDEARAVAEANIVGSRHCECGCTDTPNDQFCEDCAPPWRKPSAAMGAE